MEQGQGSGKFIFKVTGIANTSDLKITVHTNLRTLNGLESGTEKGNPTCIYPLTGVRPAYVT